MTKILDKRLDLARLDETSREEIQAFRDEFASAHGRPLPGPARRFGLTPSQVVDEIGCGAVCGRPCASSLAAEVSREI